MHRRRRQEGRREQTQKQEQAVAEHRCRDSGSRATCHRQALGGSGPALPWICFTELMAMRGLRICVRPHPCTLKSLQGQAIRSGMLCIIIATHFGLSYLVASALGSRR
jgi:hypothetical protein